MKKNKWLTGLIMASSALALVGVGFSSWIINQSTPDDATVQVAFGEVKDSSLTATLDEEDSDLSVNFDAKYKKGTAAGDYGDVGACTSDVVDNPDNTGIEDMVFVVAFDVFSKTQFTSISITTAFDSGTTSGYSNLSGYVDCSCLAGQTFTVTGQSVTNVNSANDNISITAAAIDSSVSPYTQRITLTYTFKWGETFGNVNPCNNISTGTATAGQYLNANITDDLAGFKNAYNTEGWTDKSIKLTITPSLVS